MKKRKERISKKKSVLSFLLPKNIEFGKVSRSKRAGTPINSLFWHNFLSGWFLNLWGKNDR